MYLLMQMWIGLLLAAVVGGALGWWLRRGVGAMVPASQLAAVRETAMVDLNHLRSELEEGRTWHAKELGDVRRGHQQEIRDLRAEHEGEMKRERDTFQVELASLQARRRAETAAWLARIRASSEVAAANDTHGQGRLDQAQTELRRLESQLEAARSRESELSQQLQRLTGVSATVLGPAAAQVAEVRAAFEVQIEDLQEQLAASRDALDRAVQAGEERQQRLSVDIVELRAEVQRLRAEKSEATRQAVHLHRPSRLALLDPADVLRLVEDAGAGRPPLPTTLDGAEPDELQRIDGIDAATERWLHGLGIFFYWQIAAWSAEEAAWVSQHLASAGDSVARRNWMGQSARRLARAEVDLTV